jgi:hypothetical protein
MKLRNLLPCLCLQPDPSVPLQRTRPLKHLEVDKRVQTVAVNWPRQDLPAVETKFKPREK